ncbi:metallophosphoesterase [Pseudomonas sp. MYb185]|uniref:metallophosphoesterase n=1 Tax=Pseudomonas sp. MYb185 TaxID=1848729 RepID=UPI000CFAC5F3|nr:metallophosphoesterase [Pseudomonas sp. MYb185]PRB82924.1 serine/threonine protein phosphatase [Pseudomonas sp. MYb185]
MRIHLLSDLHNEVRPFQPSTCEADVVVLAGDIDLGTRGLDWARQQFPGPVLYIPGNHEYYGGHLQRTLAELRAAADEQIRVLDGDELIIGSVRFLGTTLWTDFNATGNAPLVSVAARQAVHDYRFIRSRDNQLIQPEDTIALAERNRRWLQHKLEQPFTGKTVVISHHAPLMQSLHGNPASGNLLDAAFANDWIELLGPPVDLWLHGPSHHAVDYRFRGTRVVSNPRGYPHEDTGFDPQRVLEP